MRQALILAAFLVLSASSDVYAMECRNFPQQVVVNNDYVAQGYAVACKHKDGSWRVRSFKDVNGHDLPAPSQILYPQPFVMQTQPKTAFTPSQTINAMPLPHATFYQ